MAKKFYAVNRQTGERWKSNSDKKEYLVMYYNQLLNIYSNITFFISLIKIKNYIYRHKRINDINH